MRSYFLSFILFFSCLVACTVTTIAVLSELARAEDSSSVERAFERSLERGFRCVYQSPSRTIKWNEAWQSDQKDEGISYSIASITAPPGTAGSPILALELVATEPAERSVRYLNVDSEAFARQVCLRIVGASLSAATVESSPVTQATPKPITTPPTKPMRFITYTGNSWALADAPPKEQLGVCQVLDQNFLCRESDKRQHSDKLKDLEQELLLEKTARETK